MADHQYDAPIEHLLRELAPQVLGAVARRFRDFSSAEDAGAGGYDRRFHAMAARGRSREPSWLADSGGMPPHDRPGAQRNCPPRKRNGSGRRAESLPPTLEIEADMDPEDTLILLFMCCHRALTPSSAIALTLRGGWRFDHG